jgi:glycerophosphoryl diester phosphodiesterase
VTRFGRRDPVARVRRLLENEPLATGNPARPITVVAHRGAGKEIPENTLPAFVRAMELGAGALETDLCRTKDGVWVLWHDNQPGDPVSLARGVGAEDFDWLANWPGILDRRRKPVYEMTLAEMRDACGYSYDPGMADLARGDCRPQATFALLDELVSWSAGEPRLTALFVDVKLRPEDAAHVVELEALLDERLRRDLAVHLLLPHRELFDALVAAGPARPRVFRTPDFELPGALDDLAACGLRRASFGYSIRRTWGDFTRELAAVLRARDAGELEHVTVWTVNDEARLRELVRARVDAILTDDPALLLRVLREPSS